MSLKRVVCGISGGVDSAVAALLLKRRGFEVVGLFMRNWDIRDEKGKCSSDVDEEDAAWVCKTLDIPFFQVNFVKEYWHEVFSELIKDYTEGVTPNPDILCNRHVKFNHFINHAESKFGTNAIATGHYAKTSAGYNLQQIDPDIGVTLLCSKDTEKDQTFFLSQISQKALQKTIFPVGDLLKHEVKRIAVEAGMERIAKKKESMGICFIGSRNFHNFIEDYIEPKEGNFVDVETGKIVGKHKGHHYWTIGQRCLIQGLPKAFFACEIKADTNEVIVALGTDHPALFTDTLRLGPCHWINSPPPSLLQSGQFDAKFRFQHKHPLVGCSGKIDQTGHCSLTLDFPMRALTPGQFAVFYQDDVCVGSARILEVGPTLYELDVRERVVFPKEFS
ncbi:mitochondrial tRNA-specific 2-thiouridylase 1-like [Physella acuta]|uniref:mitochondrial tRNA-specific 2-thiouridylase 1-like n=1 Tax=Physella acuta TaxID=109671 RepID=UPI0027DC9CCB|nr:mitochondrial tRNA-specific 2-thiouridylase 1-like [Physella acuta]XP_059145422.1 mitochondrial tRNA-specific 2-thiouridylase 1-like [Physella acuta]